jgi:hypothetical protein
LANLRAYSRIPSIFGSGDNSFGVLVDPYWLDLRLGVAVCIAIGVVES